MSASHDGGHGEAPADPHTELLASFGWMALGAAILIASIRMDRLESQHINPYTAPGLLPGLLGALMLLLGALLALRSWRRGGAHRAHDTGTAVRTSSGEWMRIATVIGLCVVFDVVLVGHGLPFWAAAWIFVSASILMLQQPMRRAAGEPLTARLILKALAIGLGAGLGITLLFQELFLVRLP